MDQDAAEKLLFLTGRLAEARLKSTVHGAGLQPGTFAVSNLGIKVAALMTEAIVRNRLKGPLGADRVIVPGRARMNLDSLSDHFGVPFLRGPDELADLPQFLAKPLASVARKCFQTSITRMAKLLSTRLSSALSTRVRPAT